MVNAYVSPPRKESSSRDGSVELHIEALIRESYEIMMSKIKDDGASTMEMGPRGLEDAEEDASPCVEHGAYVEAGRAYDDNMREGVERVTLSSCGERTAMDEAGDYGGG